MSTSQSQRAKVLFRVPEDDGSSQVETLWATALGNDEYLLDNSPFYAYAVSWKDVVYAPFTEAEGMPTFLRVVEKSGHRTVRVIFDPPVQQGNESHAALQVLVSMGCTYEGMHNSYMAVDIPPDVDFDKVRDYLVEQGSEWEHADPRYSDLYPDEA